MKIKDFYKYQPAEIVSCFRDFLEGDLLRRYPNLEGKISVVITGSIPSGHYDKYSDIDTEFFYTQEGDRKKMNALVKAYKISLRQKKLPIQFHPAKTFREVQKQHLDGWDHDDALREYSTALIVIDPQNRFKNLQAQIKWYPKNVLTEKINWLFAEAVFHYHDHYVVAYKRGDYFYAESVKLRIIKLLGNALLLSAHTFPVFDKHLYVAIRALADRKLLALLDEIITGRPTSRESKGVGKLLNVVEGRLIKDGWIKKKPKDYWILLRPKYKVEMVS